MGLEQDILEKKRILKEKRRLEALEQENKRLDEELEKDTLKGKLKVLSRRCMKELLK